MTEHLFEIDRWLGTDNTSDKMSVSVPQKSGIYVYQLDNVDVDDAGKIHRRDGYGSAVYAGTKIHSMWSNDSICLFVDNGVLYKLSTAYAATALLTELHPTDPMAYAEGWVKYVYFSNSSVVGYIDTTVGTTSAFSTPTQTYKTKMVGGQCLEVFNARLYAANGKNLFYSDVSIPTQMDTRKNAIPFESRITMVKKATDGLYVSDSDKIWFLTGASPTDFSMREVLDVPAIEGMSVNITNKKRRPTMNNILFMTKYGLFEGFPQGQIIPKQRGLFKFPNATKGTAIIRNINNYQQYLGVGWH